LALKLLAIGPEPPKEIKLLGEEFFEDGEIVNALQVGLDEGNGLVPLPLVISPLFLNSHYSVAVTEKRKSG
jgi:hypothetical protein